MNRFVDAVEKKSGRKRRIPAHWLTHPTLSKSFRKPSKADTTAPAAPPAPTTTDVDPTPASTTTTDDTPAAGDKE